MSAGEGTPQLDQLDQALTTAGAAISFALAHWEDFCRFVPLITGQLVPVSPDTVREHGGYLMSLTTVAGQR